MRFLQGFVVAIGLLATPALAQDGLQAGLAKAGTITVGTSGSAPPFSMTSPTGALEGFDIDIANLIGKELGLRVEFSQIDFGGLLPGLTSGRFDMIASGVTRTPERLASTEFFLLSPYIVNGVAITRRTADATITSWKSVCGKTMGAVRGGVFQTVAQQKLPQGCVTNTREYPGSTELFLDLTNRRIDFAAHDFLGPNYLIKTGKATDIVVVDDILSSITQSVAFSKKNEALAKRVDQMIAGWRTDGTLRKLAEKWFGSSLDWSNADK
jgi:cystine transport system substrate-binding protein